jgi:ammonium transporter, Amt family
MFSAFTASAAFSAPSQPGSWSTHPSGAPALSTPGQLAVAEYVFATAVWTQIKAVLFTIVWSGVGSAILYKIVDLTVGLRVTQEEEREGLDLADHGERAYNY